jgi:hypothetical protein
MYVFLTHAKILYMYLDVHMLESMTTESHAHDISADIVLMCLSDYILQQHMYVCVYIYMHVYIYIICICIIYAYICIY